jgi:hypothetical protein
MMEEGYTSGELNDTVRMDDEDGEEGIEYSGWWMMFTPEFQDAIGIEMVDKKAPLTALEIELAKIKVEFSEKEIIDKIIKAKKEILTLEMSVKNILDPEMIKKIQDIKYHLGHELTKEK